MQAAKWSMRTMVLRPASNRPPLNAKLVIWGRKIGDKKFYPRITVMNAPKAWGATSERTRGAQKIDELRLPEELVDEPFYLIHFAAGYSCFDQNKYKEALTTFRSRATTLRWFTQRNCRPAILDCIL
jgi:hypothetical protein